ncbi:MAG TPA: adenylate/guanylate cyclase domain-containing protein [Gaiellaceae bacterium]|jgi:predicted ATPase/class 3 adenylate cyclase|nr:adenylate/guanylate cyclase domain-containing protein [Gaiellaceae bacterium]
MIVCAACGRENPAEARFCLACGSRLEAAAEAREERKVVSVLFADLVGFTSRAEQLDPEDVRATLTPYYARLRHELERRGGTVEKFIGDAVMAVFGAPLAHEDDPERAVRAALAIRDAIAEDGQLQVRAAVTTGEALVSLDAAPAEGQGMVAGDVVNTAARLQSAAPVNGVLVDGATYRATRQRIDYTEAEPVTAKGKAEPVRVWTAREARSRFGVDVVQAGGALVGRARELNLLTDALARVREERSTQLVTLVGVPGIGKSRLVYELSLAAEAEEELIFWRQGRSLPYGEGVTYWALGEMVKAQAGILDSDAPELAERKLAEAVGALQLEGPVLLLESLRPLIGLGAEGTGGDRSERFAAWRQFLEALAEERPTVLVFEDLHWAGDDLLDFVDHLVEWSSGVPLLVVCTARPELLERRPGWGGGKPNALSLSISPLSENETSRLLAGLLEQAVMPAEVQASLLARAGGNPLYAEQFARLLLESGAEDDPPLPETVQGIIAARLDALPPGEKQLLQDASVLGKVFWLGAACAVGGHEQAEAEQRMHALVRKEFVRPERRSSVGGESEYAFRHVLVRDVAYGQIPRSGRAERHERAAAWIDSLGRGEDRADMLAHHYLEALRLRRETGGDLTPELLARAREAAREAGDRALALGAYAAASRLYEAALELSDSDDELRPDLLLAYARSRVDDAALDEAVLTEAAESLLRRGGVEAAAEARARLGGVWLNRGEGSRALACLESARELVADRDPSPEKAFVLQELGRALMMAEDERAIATATESLQLAEQLGLDASRARNLNTIGCAKVTSGDRSGLEDLEQARAIGAEAHSHEESSAVANLQTMYGVLGDLRRAGELQEQTLAIARQRGIGAFIRWQEVEQAMHWYWSGRWAEAFERVNEVIEAAEEGSPHYMDSVALYVRSAILLARGDLDAAVADARLGLKVARMTNDPQSVNPAIALEAFVEATVANKQAANAVADELLAAWGDKGMRPQQEAVDGAWALVALGRTAELQAALDHVRAQTIWHDAAGRIASGDLAGAADVYAEIGSLPTEAYARLRAAEAFARAGDRAEADRQLRLALPVFTQLGATAWAADAESLLAESA